MPQAEENINAQFDTWCSPLKQQPSPWQICIHLTVTGKESASLQQQTQVGDDTDKTLVRSTMKPTGLSQTAG